MKGKSKSSAAKAAAELHISANYKPNPIIKVESTDESLSQALVMVENRQASIPSSAADALVEASASLRLQEALASEKNVDARVFRMERTVSDGMVYLKRMIPLLDEHAARFPICKEWRDQARAIIDKAGVPRVLVGVLGHTGSGKSSLLNSVVNEEFLVPTNAMRASTSVVVEISWNTSEDPADAYVAEIDFITAEEWTAEFNILAYDIKNRPEGEKLGSTSGSDASIAYARIKAVYPGIDVNELLDMTPTQLLGQKDLNDILGHIIKIRDVSSKGFYKAINGYIDSSNSGTSSQPVYWPLVKLVHLYIKAPILQHGLVLVDLPGLGDSNAGRTSVAEKFMQQLHYVWIVADVVRCNDDQVAKELMGKTFKRRLLMDGKYDDNFVTFVITKTDQINVQEVMDSLKLEEVIMKDKMHQENLLNDVQSRLNNQTGDLKRQKKKIEQTLKRLKTDATSISKTDRASTTAVTKRKFGEIEERSREIKTEERLSSATLLRNNLDEQQRLKLNLKKTVVDMKNIRKKNQKLKRDRKALKESNRNICIEKRNEEVRKRTQEDFEGGFLELRHELNICKESNDIHIVDSSKKSRGGLNTFCVSSTAYQKLSGGFRRDSRIKGFPTLEHTQIPQLQAFAEACTLPRRENIFGSILTDLFLLNVSIQGWAQNKGFQDELSLLQKEQIKDCLNQHIEELRQTSEISLSTGLGDLSLFVKTQFEPAVTSASVSSVDEAKSTCAQLIESGEIHFMTWKAICIRNGAFKSRNRDKAPYNWNDLFSEPVLGPITGSWDALFNEEMNRFHATNLDANIIALRDFSKALIESCTPIVGPSYKPLREILKQVPLLEDQIRSRHAISLNKVKNRAQGMHLAIAPSIMEKMFPVYEECAAESGQGMYARMKDILIDYINQNGEALYKGVCKKINNDTQKLLCDMPAWLSYSTQGALVKIDMDLKQIILGTASNDSDEALKSELQDNIVGKLELLENDWNIELTGPVLGVPACIPLHPRDHAENVKGSKEDGDVKDEDDDMDCDSDESDQDDDSDSDD